ncbi:hypothetical protein [Streptomyces sp. NPDC047869]|uniref:hypothetical protein n=1 Tax=Streptomyces sp. NPDC047869 TaxID=3154709 RepID=UPI003453202A
MTEASTPAVVSRYHARMVNWTRTHDCSGDADRAPALPGRVEVEDSAEAREEPGRLTLAHDPVSPAGFVALPRLVHLSSRIGR